MSRVIQFIMVYWTEHVNDIFNHVIYVWGYKIFVQNCMNFKTLASTHKKVVMYEQWTCDMQCTSHQTCSLLTVLTCLTQSSMCCTSVKMVQHGSKKCVKGSVCGRAFIFTSKQFFLPDRSPIFSLESLLHCSAVWSRQCDSHSAVAAPTVWWWGSSQLHHHCQSRCWYFHHQWNKCYSHCTLQCDAHCQYCGHQLQWEQ